MRRGKTVIGAVDIGGTKIAVGVIDAEGTVVSQAQTPTAARDGFDAAMRRVADMLRRAQSDAGVMIHGIGIGCTGPVDPASGEIGLVDFLPGWQGCNPVQHLSRAFGVSAAMENDADAAALGEAQWGAGRGKHSVICVTVGTGIGGGMVLGGMLYRGIGGAHPEIGHHVIFKDGPPCFCGARGCWEVLARGPAMVERFLREEGCDRGDITAKGICDLARRGHAVAVREVAREGEYLGLGLANLVTLFAPDVIALGGSVMGSADLFLPVIRNVIRRNCGLVPSEKVDLQLSELTPLVGASMVWRSRFEKEEDRERGNQAR